jgi:hypothetical protein
VTEEDELGQLCVLMGIGELGRVQAHSGQGWYITWYNNATATDKRLEGMWGPQATTLLSIAMVLMVVPQLRD